MIQLETHLKEVTVYPDRARLARHGRIKLPAGLQQLEIQDLPIQMNPDSARVAARGNAPTRILGLQTRRMFFSETPAEQARQLESQFETVQDEMAGLDSLLDLGKQNRARVERLADQPRLFVRALTKGELDLEAVLAIVERLRARAEELDREQLELMRRKRILERRLEQIKNQLDQTRSAQPRERYSALVELELSQESELDVELSYLVTGAGWSPLYDIRLIENGAAPGIEIGYLAQVTQQSGEIWEDVSLTLSTARPALASKAPELEPWYIQPLPRPTPLPPAAARGMAMKAAAPQTELSRLAEEPSFDVQEAFARVEATGAAVTYAVAGSVTIPPDGAAHKVVVARYSLQPKLDYLTAPTLVQAVYRRARAANESLYTLLPGKANLFVGDEFIGSTSLELTAPGGEIELFLGVDDRLRVERELKRRETDKTLLGGKRRIRYGYEISLENFLEGPAEVTIQDRFPVARHEDIKVRLEASEPKPSRQSELNLLEWELRMAAKEKVVVRFEFSVEYLQEMEVRGLP